MSETEQAIQNSVPRLSVSDWSAQTLRLTAFPEPSLDLDHPSWWTAVFQEPPDKQAAEPKLGKYAYEGSVRDGKLVLQIEPGRIDLRLSTTEPRGNEMPSLGNYLQNLDSFKAFVVRWLNMESLPGLTRIAFGATLQYQVPDRITGYRQLQPYLNEVTLDPIHSSDFFYRINRRRDSRSGIPDLYINRLSAWSVMAFRPSLVQIGPSGIQGALGPESFACRLELDVNTSPEMTGILERNKLTELFAELVELANQIIDQGDVP